MKIISKIAIGAAAVLVLVATLPPVEAACSAGRILDYFGAYVTSNPTWGGAGGDRTCGGNGCYISASTGPVSDSLAGVFWGFDVNTVPPSSASDPAFAAGVDNGAWDATFWTKSPSGVFNELYYYPAWLSVNAGSNSQPGNPPTWSSDARIDNCPADFEGAVPDSCSCLILTDQWDGVGYFTVDSAQADGIGNYTFDGLSTDAGGAATMRLIATPAPSVVTSSRNEALADVTLEVTVADITGTSADYRDAGCECGLGYLVYQQIVDRGSLAPTDRITDWIPALDAATGGVQAPTALGGTATVLVDCDPAVQQDVYLATMLVEEGGLVGGNVSSNSLRIECGANLADPSRPTDRDRGRSADAPRGRDTNRGQRER